MLYNPSRISAETRQIAVIISEQYFHTALQNGADNKSAVRMTVTSRYHVHIGRTRFGGPGGPG